MNERLLVNKETNYGSHSPEGVPGVDMAMDVRSEERSPSEASSPGGAGGSPAEGSLMNNEQSPPTFHPAELEVKLARRKAHFGSDAGKGKFTPSTLTPRHREIMRRVLEGATYVEIAEAMGLSTQAVSLIASSSMFKEELAKLEAARDLGVIQRAEELSHEALDKLKFLMRRARSEMLQASCAEKVLGIAGYSKIEKKQLQVVSGEDVIRELNRQRRELELARAKVVEVEASEE